MQDDLLTAKQLAYRIGVKPRTVREWFRSGRIPAARLTPKVIRYNLHRVLEALQDHKEPEGGSDGK